MGAVKKMPRTKRIDIRADDNLKDLLTSAARMCDKSVSEFLRFAGITMANQMLADRRHFELDDKAWEAFQDILNRPVQDKPSLTKLLREPSVLDER